MTNYPASDDKEATLLSNTLAGLAWQGYQMRTGPSAASQSLDVGHFVWVLKSKGRKNRKTKPTVKATQRFELFSRARIIANPNNNRHYDEEESTDRDDPENNHLAPRVWIQYPKGSTYHVKCERLLRILETQRGLILVWPETDVYRKSCLTHTLPAGEAFVEIGCDHGGTVDRVAQTLDDASLVAGIDKAADSIASARQRYPQYIFVQWDCLESNSAVLPAPVQELVQRSQTFHLAIDINGNREVPAVLACLQRLLVDFALKPRLVFVKSRLLFQALSSTKQEEELTHG